MILLLAALAQAAPCATVSRGEVVQAWAESPQGILVLGERHGHRRDLARARRIIADLGELAPVTVALEAVHQDHQQPLGNFAKEKDSAAFRVESNWAESWGYRFGPYGRVMAEGQTLVAAGLDLGPAPDGVALREPPAYQEYLQQALDGHTLPPDVAARFVRSMTWRDRRIAELSLGGWDGTGILVILTGRGHVEQGLGVPFQLRTMTDERLETLLLGDGGARCAAVDRVLKGR